MTNTPPKIVIVGAGSRVFSPRVLRDLYRSGELRGAELVLVDTDENALERTRGLAERLRAHDPGACRISYTTDRKAALPDADFVLTAIASRRYELWQQDYIEAIRLGFHHCFGETGGPGAVFHTLRQLPPMMEIARDIEELCPDAWLINFTNPENRVCLALDKYSSVKTIGLCHSVNHTLDVFSGFLDISRPRLDAKVAGVNHFNWMVELWDKETGEDLFPSLRARIDELGPPDRFELCARLWEIFGVFPTSGDVHVGEYMSFGHEYWTVGFDYQGRVEAVHGRSEKEISDVVEGRWPVEDWLDPEWARLGLRRELAIPVMEALHGRKTERLLSVIVSNRGAIEDLAPDGVVETAGLFENGTVRGEPVDSLPPAASAVVRQEQVIQDLVVEAWANNSRELALQALLLDPNVDSIRRAEILLDRMLDLQKDHLPMLQ